MSVHINPFNYGFLMLIASNIHWCPINVDYIYGSQLLLH